MADRVLSLLRMHSNKFSHITQLIPLDDSSGTLTHPSFLILNSSYQSYHIETSPQSMTHFMNAIILKHFS